MGKEENKKNRLSALRKKINKSSVTNSYDLSKTNPAAVTKWISTGSTWLDLLIANKESLAVSGAEKGGIPVGKMIELAGLESTGKSYMAWMIAANAQKSGMDVVFFDSEAATDASFIQRMGVDLENIIYMPAGTVENVFETIELIMAESEKPTLFIWDSLGMTPSEKEDEGTFNPNENVAVKARVISKAMSKTIDKFREHGSSLLVVNQLMTNISNNMFETEPWTTPGGKKVHYAYSLRIWLTGRKAKKWKIEDSNGNRIGSDVKVLLKKSRFGTEGRNCNFKIMWGVANPYIADEESWLDACKSSENYIPGQWNKIKMEDGTEISFQKAQYYDKLKDEKFKNRIIQIMKDVVLI